MSSKVDRHEYTVGCSCEACEAMRKRQAELHKALTRKSDMPALPSAAAVDEVCEREAFAGYWQRICFGKQSSVIKVDDVLNAWLARARRAEVYGSKS